MEVLWRDETCTARQIVQSLQATDPSWHPRTAKTLINRLLRKRAIAFNRQSRSYVYRPLVSRAACEAMETDSFLARVFGGSVTRLVVQQINQGILSPTEITQLRKVLSLAAASPAGKQGS